MEAFGDIDTVLNDGSTYEIFKQFMSEHGPFDVVHFHSLEGLSAKVLELKKDFPQTKFVISIHNYHWFCPQVNLWKHERQLCTDSHGGRDCLVCVPKLSRKLLMVRNYLIRGLNTIGLKYNHSFLKKGCKLALSFCRYLRLLNPIKKQQQAVRHNKDLAPLYSSPINVTDDKRICFGQYRKVMVERINQNIDIVLSTSNRVKTLCTHFGISESKIKTLRIGTKFAENQLMECSADFDDEELCIAYLGYMRPDKGFYFFLDALESMPADLASKLKVVIAAKVTDKGAKYAAERIRDLGQNNLLKSITLYDGYTHDTLPSVLQGVHLGIVPVLWEDNLPQVAMEMRALGVPVLTSDLGGARELTDSEAFTFPARSHEAFIAKLSYFANDKQRLKNYWSPTNRLTTMQEHLEKLDKIYFE